MASTELGPQAALSKSTVSRVCQAIREEFDAWRTRRLDDLEVDYLFVDGSYFKMHAGGRTEPVLAAWGIRRPALGGTCSPTRRGRVNPLPGRLTSSRGKRGMA